MKRDSSDNRFNPPVGRFPEIEEDEPPYRLWYNEYHVLNRKQSLLQNLVMRLQAYAWKSVQMKKGI